MEPEVTQAEDTQEEKNFQYKEGATEEEKRKTIEKRYTDIQSFVAKNVDKRFDEQTETLKSFGDRMSKLDEYDGKFNQIADSIASLKKAFDPSEPKEPARPETDDVDEIYEYNKKLKAYENAKTLKEQESLKKEFINLKEQYEADKKAKAKEAEMKAARDSTLGQLQKAGATPEESAAAYDLFINNYFRLSAEDVLTMTRAYKEKANKKPEPEKKRETPPPPPSANSGGHVESLSSEEKWKKQFNKR